MDQDTTPFSAQEYERYKRTKAALLTSSFVVEAALRSPGISQLPIVKAQDAPADWLAAHLEVESAANSELIFVRMTGTEQESNDLAKIVDAVMSAYREKVVDADIGEQLADLDSKRKLYGKLREDIAEATKALRAAETSLEDGASKSEEIDFKELEIDMLKRLAQDIGRQIQVDQLNLDAPLRVQFIQTARISRSH